MKPGSGTTTSSQPIRASTSRSASAASSLQRIDVPRAATPSRSFTNDPPSSVAVPVIVPSTGMPGAGHDA